MHEKPCLCVTSRSEAFTRFLGAQLGHLVDPGAVLALKGELGSGKTRFVQGLAQGLEVPASEGVCSPSFALIHEYVGGRLTLYHVDLYRLGAGVPDQELGLEEYFYSNGVCVIEWADRWLAWLPLKRLDVEFSVTGPRTRRISFRAWGQRYEELLDGLGEALKSLKKKKRRG